METIDYLKKAQFKAGDQILFIFTADDLRGYIHVMIDDAINAVNKKVGK